MVKVFGGLGILVLIPVLGVVYILFRPLWDAPRALLNGGGASGIYMPPPGHSVTEKSAIGCPVGLSEDEGM
jgi:hypothetical protein